MRQVLVVDDEKNVLKTLSIGLQRHEYRVKQAQNGLEALKLMNKDKFDVVVSDIRMYPMDGYTLATKIRDLYPAVNIILMSAYGFDEDSSVPFDLNLFPHLTKPFSVTELVNILKQVEGKNYPDMQRILYFGKIEDLSNLLPCFKTNTYQVETHDTADTIKHKQYDMYLIDETYLKEKSWKILNKIDKMYPDKPVIILVSQDGKQDSLSTPDLKLTVLQKNRFFKDQDWAIEMLRNASSQ